MLTSDHLRERLNLESKGWCVQNSRLYWFGHMKKKWKYKYRPDKRYINLEVIFQKLSNIYQHIQLTLNRIWISRFTFEFYVTVVTVFVIKVMSRDIKQTYYLIYLQLKDEFTFTLRRLIEAALQCIFIEIRCPELNARDVTTFKISWRQVRQGQIVVFYKNVFHI